MKLLLITFLSLYCSWAIGGEYRYDLMVTTGLQERVFDKAGKETIISFSKKSNPKAQFVLTQILELEGVNGTEDKTDWGGIPYEQAIIIHGSVKDKVFTTESGPGLAESEDYQEFVLEKIFVKFPLSRMRPGKGFDTGFLETHFSFETLFPDGLIYEGKLIDLKERTIKVKEDSATKPEVHESGLILQD